MNRMPQDMLGCFCYTLATGRMGMYHAGQLLRCSTQIYRQRAFVDDGIGCAAGNVDTNDFSAFALSDQFDKASQITFGHRFAACGKAPPPASCFSP